MFSISEKIWGSDWFIGLSVGMILLLMAQLNLLQPLEQIAYDWSIRHQSRSIGDKVAVIAIDERSLAQIGEWPWSRSVLAQLVDLIGNYSEVIGSTLVFAKPQTDSGQVYIDELATFYADSDSLSVVYEQLEQLENLMEDIRKIRGRNSRDRKHIKQLDEFYQNSVLFNQLPNTLTTLEDKLQAARIDLDSDQQLANSFKRAQNVVLGMPFWLGKANDMAAPSLPDYVQKHRLRIIRAPFDSSRQIPQPPSGVNAIPPLLIFANNVSGIGYFNPDFGRFNSRKVPLVIKYKNSYFPSLSLLLAAKSLGGDKRGVEVQLGQGVRMGQWRVNTDTALYMRPFFYQDTEVSSLRVDSFVDVLWERISAKKYQNKIVILGVTARHLTDYHSTPLGLQPSVIVLAHTVASLLNEDFIRVPDYAVWLQFGLFIITVTYIGFLLPSLKWYIALFVTGGWIIILLLFYFSLLNQGFLVQLMPIILHSLSGHIALQIKRGIVAYQDAFRLHPDAVESNRLLGLAFQGQGHLDLAFEKFRLCPPDEAIMGLLYNLALDYERKREFRRASAVYRYIISHVPDFRDVSFRLERIRRFRKPKLSGNLNDWLFLEGSEKPVLGRYQIEKPLGKGAMGVVYLGKDAKLDRLVAIKTLPLAQEFEPNGLQEATIRFFREASAAGRLTHPHIVTIYEAGEEQDLAYISMEFFKGGNLVPYTQPDNLLPIPTVVEIVIQVAEALDYAHKQGVVHRDIKPANIMYNPATGQIKITDFGIARITDFNKTKTGTLMGTPSYMSPEQLASKQVDGRTDLYSLGVMLYQLLTGKLPFYTDSLATLMFKIVNESPPNILSIRASVPPDFKRVVERALQKDVAARYQSGAEFASALRDCDKLGEI
jgi:CHASE2 domain-containing sensor protein